MFRRAYRVAPIVLCCSLLACTHKQPSGWHEINATSIFSQTRAFHLTPIQIANRTTGRIPHISISRLLASRQQQIPTVQIEFANGLGRSQAFDYRIRWLDQRRFQSSAYSAWQTERIEASASAVVLQHAPTIQTHDFVIELRPHQ